jgi:hypothetical protein
MNGAFRIHVFAGDLVATKSALEGFAAFIDSPTSFFARYRPNPEVASSIVDGPAEVMNHDDHAKNTHAFNPCVVPLSLRLLITNLTSGITSQILHLPHDRRDALVQVGDRRPAESAPAVSLARVRRCAVRPPRARGGDERAATS